MSPKDLAAGLGIARFHARRLRHQFPQLDFQEILSEANVGLVLARDSYKPGRSKFTTWANRKIWFHLLEWVRTQTWFPRSALRRARTEGKNVPRVIVGYFGEGLLVENRTIRMQ
jgi:DNA-directed RNA polymerase specialized sigma24 family protein